MSGELTRLVTVAKSSRQNPTRYHTRVCVNYPELRRLNTLSDARRRGLSQCKFCSGDVESSGGSGPKLANQLHEIGKRKYG